MLIGIYFFCSSPEKRPTSRMLRVPLACAPYMKNFAKTEAEALRYCKIDVQCMRDITVEEVYGECRNMVEGLGSRVEES